MDNLAKGTAEGFGNADCYGRGSGNGHGSGCTHGDGFGCGHGKGGSGRRTICDTEEEIYSTRGYGGGWAFGKGGSSHGDGLSHESTAGEG